MLKKTMVVARSLGKEHGRDGGLKVNPPEVVEAHIQYNIKRAAQTPEGNWAWWQMNDNLLVEKPRTDSDFNDSTTFYLS